MRRQNGWDFSRSHTAVFGQLYADGFPGTENLAGPEGCHIHVWLPRSVGSNAGERQIIEGKLRAEHDLVSCSWEPYTEEVEAWFNADRPPAGHKQAKMPIILAHHKDREGLIKLFWRKGERMTVDAFSLSVVCQVYEQLNEKNKENLREMIERDPIGCMRAIDVAFKVILR